MTDNLDDFEDDFEDAAVQQPPAAKKAGMADNLKAAWNGSPLFKLFILVVGVGALAAAIIAILSGGDDPRRDPTRVSSSPALTAIPGTKAPPEYVNAVKEASQQRVDEAIEANKSALPTPVSSDATLAGFGDGEEESKYDPLAEFRPAIPEDSTVAQPTAQEPIETIDPDLLARMQSQMTALFESWRPEGIKQLQVIDPDSLKKEVVQTSPAPLVGKVIIPAGKIIYAQLLTEANTDAPSPILAEIMSGPFTGGRAIGEFEATREYLVLRFSKITYKKKDYSISAFAIDPNTTLAGLVTEKDNRYFTRVLLPTAASFLEAFGSAISSPNRTTTVQGDTVIIAEEGKRGLEDGLYAGLSEGVGTIGDFFREEAAATKPLIRVAPGTPMGLFFINSVTDGNPNPDVITSNPVSGGGAVSRDGLTTITPVSPSSLSGVTINPSSSLAGSGLNIIQTSP